MLCNFLLCSLLERALAFLPSFGSSLTDTYVGFLSRGVNFGLFSLAAPGLEARLRLCILEQLYSARLTRLYFVLHFVSRATVGVALDVAHAHNYCGRCHVTTSLAGAAA